MCVGYNKTEAVYSMCHSSDLSRLKCEAVKGGVRVRRGDVNSGNTGGHSGLCSTRRLMRGQRGAGLW